MKAVTDPAMLAQLNDSGAKDFDASYNTVLTAAEEPGFQQWKAQHAPNDSGEDYDLRGAFKAGLTPDKQNGHFADTFKKPNHPTFSNESRYAQYGVPGRWDGDKFIAPSLKPVENPELLAQLEEKPVERSMPEKLVRAVGRTVRAGVQGVTALPNMLGDAVGLRSSEAVRNALTKFGLPEAENATERVAENVAGGMAGAGGMVKLGQGMAAGGNALVKRIGEVLESAPHAQIAAGATGPGAASVVKESGGGPVAQLAAGVVGGAVPAIPALAAAATRAAVRGGAPGRAKMQENIDTFEDAGAGTPTVGQATESRVMRTIESLLSKMPGSAGRMTAKAEAEAAGLGGKIDEMASSVAPRTGAAPAGRAISAGIKEFGDEFRMQSGKLYDKLDTHIQPTARVDVSNTRSALEKLNSDIPGAPNVSQLFKNARIKGIEGALKADTETTAGVHAALPAWQKQLLEQMPEVERTAMLNGLIDGKLPYEALKKLRTLVGNEISDSTIASDVPRSKWKALYGALSKDMGAAASEAGPKAEAAFVRANNFHRAGMKRVEDVLDPIMAKGDPEDVFKAAVSGTKEGATTIQGVMKSLPAESRKVVSGTMLRRLGKATPGQQDELGEVFSSETFLTNWNKLHPDAKRTLFAPLSKEMTDDLDQIAKVAANMREGSKVFANPSGTAQALSSRDTAAGAVIAVLTGHPAVAAGIAGTVASANIGARALTNPNVVHWLAEATKAPIEQLPAQLNQLFQQSLYMKADERREVRQFVKDAREATREQAQSRSAARAVPQ